jgi:phage terminase small subunit
MSTKRQPKPEPKRTESGLRRVQVFVEEYLVDLNAARAAEVAGFSPKTARYQGKRLLRRPDVAEAVAAAMAARVERTHVTQDYVLQTIRETVERCRQAVPVTGRRGEPVMTTTPDGEVVPAWTFDSSGVLRGCELLGKHLGMFTERREISGVGGGPVEILAGFTDDELIARLKAKRGT